MPSDGKPVDNGDKDLRRETCGKNIPSRGKTTPTQTPSVYVRYTNTLKARRKSSCENRNVEEPI